MSRNIDATLLAALQSGSFSPVLLVDLTFVTGVEYVWSGVGPFEWSGNTYVGVGSLGNIGAVSEDIAVRATGTTVGLSGIDQTLAADALSEIQIGAPAHIYLGAIGNGVLEGTPYLLYSGTMDITEQHTGADTVSLVQHLENKLINLHRGTNRRYTSADQRLYYPTDTSMASVEKLNDAAFRWGG